MQEIKCDGRIKKIGLISANASFFNGPATCSKQGAPACAGFKKTLMKSWVK
jgi:hypothetical protein